MRVRPEIALAVLAREQSRIVRASLIGRRAGRVDTLNR
jgi:hypothetical protein